MQCFIKAVPTDVLSIWKLRKSVRQHPSMGWSGDIARCPMSEETWHKLLPLAMIVVSNVCRCIGTAWVKSYQCIYHEYPVWLDLYQLSWLADMLSPPMTVIMRGQTCDKCKMRLRLGWGAMIMTKDSAHGKTFMLQWKGTLHLLKNVGKSSPFLHVKVAKINSVEKIFFWLKSQWNIVYSGYHKLIKLRVLTLKATWINFTRFWLIAEKMTAVTSSRAAIHASTAQISA